MTATEKSYSTEELEQVGDWGFSNQVLLSKDQKSVCPKPRLLVLSPSSSDPQAEWQNVYDWVSIVSIFI